MTTERLSRLLTKGARIEKGSFSGYWLTTSGGKRLRLAPSQAREWIPQCVRIDDRKSQCGAIWALLSCPKCGGKVSSDHNSYSCHKCQMLWPLEA